MNWSIAGLGIQGRKRSSLLGSKVRCTIDPLSPLATFKNKELVALTDLDLLAISTPNDYKLDYVLWALSNNIGVLVEKPFLLFDFRELQSVSKIASELKLPIYTAYNHRFEPSIIKLKSILETEEPIRVYQVFIQYENGTAIDISQSPWKDTRGNLISDLGSHVIDLYHFLFARVPQDLRVYEFGYNETAGGDFCTFGNSDFSSRISYISWKSKFLIDIVTESRTYRISGLQKWGKSTLEIHYRRLPSGVPTIELFEFTGEDKTWVKEHDFMEKLMSDRVPGLISHDLEVNPVIESLISQLAS
jgi:predicted dehydrogenase